MSQERSCFSKISCVNNFFLVFSFSQDYSLETLSIMLMKNNRLVFFNRKYDIHDDIQIVFLRNIRGSNEILRNVKLKSLLR